MENPTIRKTFQGGYEISDIIKGHLISLQYIGYSKKEALKRFRKDVKKVI